MGKDALSAKIKLNTLVTFSHIGVTIAFTTTLTILYFYKNDTQAARMYSAFLFFGGLADMFLSIMLWFILDSEKVPSVFVDGERIYAVTEVIRVRDSGINEDCLAEEEQDELNERVSRKISSHASGIARRMIEQFFTEEEGPDRDWSQSDFDPFG